MSKPVLPSLSIEGFITNKSIIMGKVYEHFLASEYSQSNTFDGMIGSLKYLINEHKTTDELKRNIQETLGNMYRKYFKTAEVTCTVTESETSAEQIIAIEVSAVDEDDETYTLSRAVNQINGKIINFDILTEEMYNGK